ncbi:hypothetical protein U472_07880 [Orenia metallireducens]|jgi:hypothetical protein|uniref:Uncharacterized protein n=1 Tax=Orenia metallireducens TaxID=1413210 RepID=A0A1C0AAP1_9FIRM|nr:hypothetical protein [Orenia metallireducens]OCL27368.1 hypothetical protein U472_07880 [Orenia metallireducens]
MDQEELEMNVQNNLDDDNFNQVPTLEEKKYIVIHGKLTYGGRNKTYGLFRATINRDNGELINLDVAFSNKDEVVYVEPSSKAFDRIFSKISDKEKLAGRRLRIYLLNNITKNETFLFVDLLVQGDLEQIKNILRLKLEDFIREAVDLSIHGEFQTKEEIKYSHPNLIINEDDELDNIEEEIIELDVTPIIAPIDGKKISQFEKNDEILVKAREDSYNEYRDIIFNFIVDANKRHIKGVIDYILFNDSIKTYDIIIKFSSNIYSQLLIEAEDELKLAIPPKEEEIENIEKDYELIKKRIREEVENELRNEIEQRLRVELKAEIREELEEELIERLEQELRIELEREIRERIAKEEEVERFKEGDLLFKNKPIVVTNKLIINLFIWLNIFLLIVLGLFYYFKKPL